MIENGADNSSSVFVSTMLSFQKQSFTASQKLGFINQLFTKGNIYLYYLNHLTDEDIGLSIPEIKKYLYELFDKQVYPYMVWLAYFKKADIHAKHEAACKILAAPDIDLLQYDIVVVAFDQKGYDENSKQEIEKAKHKAAIKILAAPDITLLQHDIVVAAFDQKGYDETSKQEIEKAKHEAACKILAAPDITLLIHHIVVAAFDQKGYDEESKQEIEKAKHKAVSKILAAPDITLLQPEIVVAAFHQKGYDETSKQKIEKAKHKAATKILDDYDWDSKKDTMMFQALRFFSNEATYPSRVNELVTEIINQFHQHKHERDSSLYFRRLNIIVGYPFHNIAIWKGNCLYYITSVH